MRDPFAQAPADCPVPAPAAGRCRPGGTAFVVLAGGSGTRVGAGLNKVYLPVAGRPVISWSLSWADQVPEVGVVVLVIRPEDAISAAAAIRAAGLSREVEVITGGSTRHRSEQAALDHLRGRIDAGDLDVIAIHDGARPLAGAALLRQVVLAAAEHGGAVPTLPEQEVWRIDRSGRLSPPDLGHQLHRVQTPQAFEARALGAAYDAARLRASEGSDTSATLAGVAEVTVVAVPGQTTNLKVTFPEDLARAEHLLS